MNDKIDLDLYSIIYEKTGMGYSSYSKVLPGCTSSGFTKSECENHMRDAIKLHLEGLRADGVEVKIDPRGNVFWHNKFGLHRDNDLPAIEWKDGIRKEWFKNGKRHRVGGYALIDIDGDKEWYRKGMLHRNNDLPAVEFSNGIKKWYKDGVKHRESGPAVIHTNGVGEFWIDGVRVQKEDKK